jgi:ribosomal protein S19E (S16A)
MLFRHDILQGIAEGRVTLAFRRWRLKELGLTESLEIGYRLSPRGRSVLDRLTGFQE